MIVFIVILSIVWMAMQGSFTIADFIVGLLMSLLVVYASRRSLFGGRLQSQEIVASREQSGLVQLAWNWVRFTVFSLWSIIKSNVDVARVVLSPTMPIKPGIIGIPLDVQSERGMTILANIITLTPGTVSLDISSDRKTLYIHTLDVGNAENLRRDIKEDFERRVLKLAP
jgi:multicomponent Na+:H+ antiporter subunit E